MSILDHIFGVFKMGHPPFNDYESQNSVFLGVLNKGVNIGLFW